MKLILRNVPVDVPGYVGFDDRFSQVVSKKEGLSLEGRTSTTLINIQVYLVFILILICVINFV